MSHTLLQVEAVSKSYGSLKALDSVSFTLNQGEFFGLLGPNGAGKSTLMNLLIGYLTPDSGSITGFRNSAPVPDLRMITGYTPQALALYEELSALSNMRIFASFYGLHKKETDYRAAQLLEMSGLYERKNDVVSSFSGGMKRRLNLAISLLHNPDLIICDEPTVGVDPQSRNALFDFLEALNKEGKTIIYTTHYMEEAERLCKKIAIIDHGRIITSGTKEELLAAFPFSRLITGPAALAQQYPDIFIPEHLEQMPGDKFALRCGADTELLRLLNSAEQAGVPLAQLEFEKPALESLFLHLTGRSLRD